MKNCYLVNILIVARATKLIIPFDGQVTAKDIKLYRLKIGFFIYLVTQTRLDIIYGVSMLLYFLLNPSLQHIKAIN